MSILIDQDTKLLVQGITGSEGQFHANQMQEYGTQVVAGVTPGKENTSVQGVPVYDSARNAVDRHPEIDTSVIFVPAAYAQDAIFEAVDNGISTLVCITEHIPVHDMISAYHYVNRLSQTTLIGPNCPGVISPGLSKVGIMPGAIFEQGSIGLVSRSGTLTYEIASRLSEKDLGQSTVVGIGGDQIIGSDFVDIIEKFERDPATELIVLVGEIGGSEEEQAAKFISEQVSTPAVAYIAGFSAPKGKRMGHAGAIISGEASTATAKQEILQDNGIPVGRSPAEVAELAEERLNF